MVAITTLPACGIEPPKEFESRATDIQLPMDAAINPRVTSGFSRRRLHPVYRVARAHLGVDLAASVGTPVLAVADDVVVSAGFSGASGAPDPPPASTPLVEQRKLPAGDPISAGLLKAFEAVRDDALAQLTKQLAAAEILVAGSREPADAPLARP